MNLKQIVFSEKTSLYFEEYRKNNLYTEELKELYALIDIEQNPQFHPEGSVWNHTMMVVDEAAKYKSETQNPYGYMLAALCHYFGKAITTEMINGRIRSFDHEKQGLPLVKEFLNRFHVDAETLDYVLNLVENHMKPNTLFREKSSVRATNRMFRRALDANALILLGKADHQGRGEVTDYTETEAFLRERLEIFETVKENH